MPSLTPEEYEILEELEACAGEIDHSNYTDEQHKILHKLQTQRPSLVALRWVIVPEGRKVLMTKAIEGSK